MRRINSIWCKKMPVIILEGPELTQSQRKELIKGLTEVACNIIPDIPKEAYYVFLREYPGDKVGVGGLQLPEHLANLRKKQTES